VNCTYFYGRNYSLLIIFGLKGLHCLRRLGLFDFALAWFLRYLVEVLILCSELVYFSLKLKFIFFLCRYFIAHIILLDVESSHVLVLLYRSNWMVTSISCAHSCTLTPLMMLLSLVGKLLLLLSRLLVNNLLLL
jgi:hypothetical protein